MRRGGAPDRTADGSSRRRAIGAVARRFGVVAAGIVIVAATTAGAAVATPHPPGPPNPGGGLLPGLLDDGTSTLNNTFATANSTITTIDGGLNGGEQTYAQPQNTEACDALGAQYDAAVAQVVAQARVVNTTATQPALTQAIQLLDQDVDRAQALSQTLDGLGCGSSTPVPNVATMITNPCVIVGTAATQTTGVGNTQNTTGTCTYGTATPLTPGTTTTTSLGTVPGTTTTTTDPGVVTALPQSQIAGSSVPVGGVRTGGWDGP